MTLDWATGLLIAAALQALVIAAMLASTMAGRPADTRLAALLVVLAFKGLPYMLGWRGHAEAPDWLALLPLNAPLAIGPLLYLTLFARANGRPARREWLHLLPALAEFAYDLGCLMLPAELRHGWKETGHDHVVKPLLELAFVVSLFAYTVAALRLSRQLRHRVTAERSDADRQAAPLLVASIVVLMFTAIAYLAIFLVSNFVAEVDIGGWFLWLAFVAMALSVEGWRGAALPAIPAAAAAATPRERVVHDWAALGARWRDRIAAEGWWREPEVTVAILARRIGVNAAYLSRAINEGLGVNFNAVINAMRAEEVARCIDAGNGVDLLGLALEAGFSSKATFNRAFQTRWGMSPGAYRQRLKS